MSKLFLKALARHTGFTQTVKQIPPKFGYNLVHNQKTPWRAWDGLATRPIQTILDVGASNGSLAKTYFLPYFPKAHIHCFEPIKKSFEQLEEVSKNSNGRLSAYNFGLGNIESQPTFNLTSDAPTASSLLPLTDSLRDHFPNTRNIEKVTVDIKVLDDIAEQLTPSLEKDILIKLDVQGFEENVILGGQKTFSKARACIIEITNAVFYEAQPSFGRIYKLMTELGFEFEGVLDQHHDSDGHILYYDALFLKQYN